MNKDNALFIIIYLFMVMNFTSKPGVTVHVHM